MSIDSEERKILADTTIEKSSTLLMHDIYQKAIHERRESIKEQPMLISVSQREFNKFNYTGNSSSINNDLSSYPSLPSETLLSGKRLV